MPNVVAHDGRSIHFEEAGAGDPGFVFVHGWCCDHTYFSPQFDYFSSSHRVVAIDLPGFGESDPIASIEISGYAEAVIEVSGALGLQKPVLVGHSMGGITVLAVAARQPDLPGAVIMVDPAPIAPSEQVRDLLAGFTAQLDADHDASVRRGFIESFLFAPTDDAGRKELITEQMCSVDYRTAYQAFAALWRWEAPPLAAVAGTPVLCLLADALGINTPEHIHFVLPTAEIGVTVGAGHFNQLEVPSQVNAMIERFVNLGMVRH